jgi:CheY-like chemotaxis protein
VHELTNVRVLLVEDHDDSREVLRVLLERCGAQVTDVPGARAALAEIERAVPDVLVTDISMPGEDGFWLLRSVRRTPAARLPVVAVTAVANPDRVLAEGFAACLRKPVDPDALCAAVARALAA